MGIFQELEQEQDFESSTEGFDALPEKEDTSFGAKYQKNVVKPMENFSVGFAKGGLKTVKNLGSVGEWILNNTAGRAANAFLGNGWKPTDQNIYGKDATIKGKNVDEILTPEGTAENIGFATERIAEFLAPSGSVNKLANLAGNTAMKVAPAGIKTGANLLGQGVVQGSAAFAQTGIQRGKIDAETKTAAIIATVFPFISEGVSRLGTQIINRAIKPSIQDAKNGFKIENIKKYDVGGSLSTSLTKTTNKLNEFSSQLDDKLATSDVTIDISRAFKETADELKNKKSLIFGQVRDVNAGIDDLASDLQDFQKAFDGELDDFTQVPIRIANNQIKRGAGTKGAWVYGKIDKNAEAIDKVYSVFYNKLKKQIEEVGPAGIKELNKAMHELIPIQSALLRRIPVADRSNIVGLESSMALLGSVFDPRALAVFVPSYLSKKAAFGNLLTTAADNWFAKMSGAGIKTGVSLHNSNQSTEQ